MNAALRLLGLLALVGVIGYLVWGGTDDVDPTQKGGASDGELRVWQSSEECASCHPEIHAEWQGSWHARAYTDPAFRSQSESYRKRDCVACHAPRPIFETGTGLYERVLPRADRLHEGVDCLTCHLLPDGRLASARPDVDTTAPCAPVFMKALQTVDVCAPCHNQHDTVDEWRRSPQGQAGVGCNDCHMPVEERAPATGRSPRPVRTHVMKGGHYPDYVATAFKVETEIRDGRLRVGVKNTHEGHNLPTDDRGRALDLVVTIQDAAGNFVPPPESLVKPGQTEGTFRARFRLPYRDEFSEINTQIPPGENATFEWELPAEKGRATVELYFKLQPYILDGADDSARVHRQELEF